MSYSNHPAAVFLAKCAQEDKIIADLKASTAKPGFLCAHGAGLGQPEVFDLWHASLAAAGIGTHPQVLTRESARKFGGRIDGEAGVRIKLALKVAEFAELKGFAPKVIGGDFLEAVESWRVLPSREVTVQTAPASEQFAAPSAMHEEPAQTGAVMDAGGMPSAAARTETEALPTLAPAASETVAPAQAGVAADDMPPASARERTRPVTRTAAQDAEILAKLRELGYDPKALPPYRHDAPGAKAAVRAALGSRGMWDGTTIFKKAWERLSAAKSIQYTD